MINGAGILNQRISMDITIHRLVGCEADQSLLLCWLIDRLSSGAMHNDVIIKDNNTWLSTTRQNITSALFKSSKVCRTTTDKLTKRGFINIERGNGGILISLTAKFIKEYQNTSNRSFNEVYNYNSSLILPDISGKLK